jgi:hypothetical protein
MKSTARISAPETRSALRTLAAISTAGALSGVLVGGIGGRLAMMLLAHLNPQVRGVESDDGFVMGQFRVGPTLSLLLVSLGLGVLGAAIYAVLRGLMIGPRWFQVLSISVGPAVVVGNLLVHTDGVDFTLIDTPGLAIALFVLVPGAYAVLLTMLAEQWAAPGSWFHRAPMGWVAATLLVWVVGFFLLPLLVVLWLAREALRRNRKGAAALAHPTGPWAVRGALSVAFVASAVTLTSKAVELT